MTTASAPKTEADKVYDYIIGRVTTYLDNRADFLAKFMDRGVPANGWVQGEALYALSGKLASEVVKITAVRGVLTGHGKEEPRQPDFEIQIGTEAHQLMVRSVLVTPTKSLAQAAGAELAPAFDWLNALPARAAILVVAFPQAVMEDSSSAAQQYDSWRAFTQAVEAKNGKVQYASEYFIPNPPKKMERFACALIRHKSQVK